MSKDLRIQSGLSLDLGESRVSPVNPRFKALFGSPTVLPIFFPEPAPHDVTRCQSRISLSVPKPLDLRKSIDGLAALLKLDLEVADLRSGAFHFPQHPSQSSEDFCTGVACASGRTLDSRGLRSRQFFSLGELDTTIGLLMDPLNYKPFKKLHGSRRTGFEAVYQPAPLLRLRRMEKRTRPHRLPHEVDGHLCSVSYQLVKHHWKYDSPP